MNIKLTSIYVDDQEKALAFYTGVLGFTRKADFTNGPFRWLTVTSPDDPDAPNCSWHSTTIRRQRPISRPSSSRASRR
ncbi:MULTISPECIES: VOC family protein [unclassified Mesorhizobium]|uniref:VOC family protein n=1 Tax=unclassified Mesorhizobium TaxID=325217 RepID=UPI002479165D|nr:MULTISPECIES: VOC family protein [unclassified Mesorhizobium]